MIDRERGRGRIGERKNAGEVQTGGEKQIEERNLVDPRFFVGGGVLDPFLAFFGTFVIPKLGR